MSDMVYRVKAAISIEVRTPKQFKTPATDIIWDQCVSDQDMAYLADLIQRRLGLTVTTLQAKLHVNSISAIRGKDK